MNHYELAKAYLVWIGKRGTRIQILNLMQDIDYATLYAMCKARGVNVDKK